jgi:hypothetical protein
MFVSFQPLDGVSKGITSFHLEYKKYVTSYDVALELVGEKFKTIPKFVEFHNV